MSAPAEVLPVLAEAIDFVDGFVGDDLQEGIDELLGGLKETRAALVEAIEAAKWINFTPLAGLPDDHHCVITVSAGNLRRFNAALARVGGTS